jgi:hypothetical protein
MNLLCLQLVEGILTITGLHHLVPFVLKESRNKIASFFIVVGNEQSWRIHGFLDKGMGIWELVFLTAHISHNPDKSQQNDECQKIFFGRTL